MNIDDKISNKFIVIRGVMFYFLSRMKNYFFLTNYQFLFRFGFKIGEQNGVKQRNVGVEVL